MLNTLKVIALSALLLPAASICAQTEDSASSSTAPVARVYVTRPTHLDGFNVSSAGKLKGRSGPFSAWAWFFALPEFEPTRLPR